MVSWEKGVWVLDGRNAWSWIRYVTARAIHWGLRIWVFSFEIARVEGCLVDCERDCFPMESSEGSICFDYTENLYSRVLKKQNICSRHIQQVLIILGGEISPSAYASSSGLEFSFLFKASMDQYYQPTKSLKSSSVYLFHKGIFITSILEKNTRSSHRT